MITSQLQIFPLQLNCWSRIWRWWVLGASFWMWSSPRSSAPVWTGCKQILSWRQSPWGSTCGSPWSISDWKTHKNTQSRVQEARFLISLFFKNIYSDVFNVIIWAKKKTKSPGKHVTGFFNFITGNVVFNVGLVDPRLNVHNLLSVVVWHRGAVDLIWENNTCCSFHPLNRRFG